jgi:hypothetical protein
MPPLFGAIAMELLSLFSLGFGLTLAVAVATMVRYGGTDWA